jgi:hypothetical protein
MFIEYKVLVFRQLTLVLSFLYSGWFLFCGLRVPGPIVIKKTMSPCSIWQGLWAAAQERRCFCVYKRGNSSPLSKYCTWGIVYTPWTKQGVEAKCLWLGQIRQVDWAAAEQLLIVASQAPSLGWIGFMTMGSEPVLLNVYGAPELIPRNEFRQPM